MTRMTDERLAELEELLQPWTRAVAKTMAELFAEVRRARKAEDEMFIGSVILNSTRDHALEEAAEVAEAHGAEYPLLEVSAAIIAKAIRALKGTT